MKKLLLFLLLPLLAVAQLPRLPQQGQFTPSFVLDLTKGTLPSSFTCTRSGTATRFNALGQLETVAANAPRFDYDPTTYQNMNLLAPSEDYSGGIWARVGSTVSQTAVTAPIAASVTLLTETTATSGHTLTGSNVSTAICTFSIYAKAAGRNFLWLYFGGYSGGSTWFDLASGTAANVEGNVTAAIVNLGDGWYRCSITKKNAQNHSSVAANLANSSTATTYTGDGVSGILLTGAQLETGMVVGPYTKTTTVPVATTTFATLKGLLIEDSKVNVLPYSSELDNALWGKSNATVQVNTSVAPDGTVTADRINDNATNASHEVANVITTTVTSGVVYTASVFVRPDSRTGIQIALTRAINDTYFNNVASSPSCQAVGGGWYRCSVTGTATSSGSCSLYIGLLNASGVKTYAGDGSGLWVWGAQVEIGRFASSYIPTAAAAVTRNTDYVVTNSVRWANRFQGTFVGEIWTPNNGTSNQGLFSFNNGGGTIRVDVRYPFTLFVNNSSFASGTGVNNTVQRFAGAYRANYMAFSATGATASIITSNSLPTGLSQLQIGTLDGGASNALNGHVRRLSYYPNVLPATYLRRVSQ